MKKLLLLPVLMLTLTAGMCSSTTPGVEVRTVTVVKEVQKPCAAEKPKRPEKVGTLPPNAVDASILLAAKLLEWAGSGGYADRAESALDSCITP